MLMLKISDVGILMKKLLYESETAFDAFLLSEAVIKMGNTFTIDGHINRDFYTSEELEQLKEEAHDKNQQYDEELSRWAVIKSHVLAVIKGRKTPASFSIVMYLSKENTEKFLSGIALSPGQLLPDVLMLHLKFDSSGLYAVTGTSYPGFTIDRTIDREWDRTVKKFFNSLQIAYEELS